ncbi:AEC family transporter (plasmid) [Pseudomonas luteola]|uniref:AEC family transporter n=1 Tax=Pseudomonas TaxID=286 RepID=UPI003DA05C77
MYTVLAIVLPIFALILAGFICQKTNRLGGQAASEINKMVVWLCLPALLFKVTATASWAEIWQPGFIISFGGGTLAIFVATLVWRLCTGYSLVTSSIDGLSAGYANTGYIGIPLCTIVFGQPGLQPALISTIIIVCMLFAIAVICIEIGLQEERQVGRAIAVVVKALSKNPLVIAPIAGAAWATTGIPLAHPVMSFLDMLAIATTPCALVSLGLFLGQKTVKSVAGKSPWPLVTIKLVGQPLLTWFLAFKVFALQSMWANSALLLSALPTGTGPFMLAEFYRREAGLISRTILISTLGSLATLTGLMIWMSASIADA